MKVVNDMSLYSIDAQITSLHNSIFYLNQELKQKKVELKRLIKTLSELMDYKDEFRHNQKLCTKPELSKNTWHGQLAEKFQSFRLNDLLSSYQFLSNNQMNRILAELKEKIESIKQMIGDLESTIASQERRLSYLYELKRREEMNDD